MSGPVATIVSFRLGGGDGVSVESSKWSRALGALGFEVTTVAGEGEADRIVPGLAMRSSVAPRKTEVAEALSDADVVIVENLCSLPLNPRAEAVVADELRGRRALLHHHDLPWQREQFSQCPPPPDDTRWCHVTINQMSRHQLAERGIRSTVIRNTFDLQAPMGDGKKARSSIGADASERIVLQPTRAIPRKNVPLGIDVAEKLGATYWLLGPAEDGFGQELESIVAKASCKVVLGHGAAGDRLRIEDAYAASDVVALPSVWEGFGNPAVESAVHRRPLAIGPYPVAAELASFGFRWFSALDPERLSDWLDHPDLSLLDQNHSVADRFFSERDLPDRIARVFARVGWFE